MNEVLIGFFCYHEIGSSYGIGRSFNEAVYEMKSTLAFLEERGWLQEYGWSENPMKHNPYVSAICFGVENPLNSIFSIEDVQRCTLR